MLAEAQAMATELASGPTFAHAMTKTMLHREWDMGVDEAIDAEAEAQAICMTTRDFKRAYEAFAARRKPVFEGRTHPLEGALDGGPAKFVPVRHAVCPGVLKELRVAAAQFRIDAEPPKPRRDRLPLLRRLRAHIDIVHRVDLRAFQGEEGIDNPTRQATELLSENEQFRLDSVAVIPKCVGPRLECIWKIDDGVPLRARDDKPRQLDRGRRLNEGERTRGGFIEWHSCLTISRYS